VGDFQCNYCRALANHLERMREAAPQRIRLIFVNAPIDSRCNPAITGKSHEDACWLAEAGECAAEEGKFWAFHDWLYRRMAFAQVKKATVDRRFAEIGLDPGRVRECMSSGRPRAAVEADLALCRELGLTTTPSLVLNGHVKRGSVFPWMLRGMVRAALRAAARAPAATPASGG
jgi:protein-disulfide isomerase